MVTASHNPPQDNGYKVYLGDGSQIVSPVDALIAERIAEVSSVADVPLAEDGWETLGDDVWQDYLRDAAAVVEHGAAADVSVVHTALHGVGTETVLAAFDRAGFQAPNVVESQASPIRPSRRCPSPTPRSPAPSTRRSSSPSRPGPTSSSPTTRMPTGAPPPSRAPVAGGCCGRRGGRAARSHLLAKGAAAGVLADSPTACSRTRSCRHGCSRPSAGRPGCGTRRRSPGSSGSRGFRGCATDTRRPSATASTRTRCATRTASPRRYGSPNSPPTCCPTPAQSTTYWTSWPPRTVCTRPTRSRSASRTSRAPEDHGAAALRTAHHGGRSWTWPGSPTCAG